MAAETQKIEQDNQQDDKKGSIRALSALNFFLADVQNGAALAAGNIAQVLAQTSAGGLVDQLRQKRQLIVVGSLMILAGCLGIMLKTIPPVVIVAQVLIGIAGAIFPLCIAAITLGLVGREKMDRQTGKNQAFNAAGNCFAALLIGLIGYFLGLQQGTTSRS